MREGLGDMPQLIGLGSANICCVASLALGLTFPL